MISYPVVDGFTLRVPLRVHAELQRMFPARTIKQAVPKNMSEVIEQNRAAIEHNKTNQEKIPLMELVYEIREVAVPAGTVDFTMTEEVVRAYAAIVNGTPEVKNGTKDPVAVGELLDDLTDVDKIRLIEFISAALNPGSSDEDPKAEAVPQ